MMNVFYAFIFFYLMTGIVEALPNQGSTTNREGQAQQQLPRPLYYDIIDSTDVLAIPSDSSGWDQEDEYENFEKQSEEYSKQHKPTPPK
jgi:hypothetical protein